MPGHHSEASSATPVLNTLCGNLNWAKWGDNLYNTIARVIVASTNINNLNSTVRKNVHPKFDTHANNAKPQSWIMERHGQMEGVGF
jgi:hypothetical protein